MRINIALLGLIGVSGFMHAAHATAVEEKHYMRVFEEKVEVPEIIENNGDQAQKEAEKKTTRMKLPKGPLLSLMRIWV